METNERLGQLAIEHLEAKVAVNGIGSVKFKDGEMIMISVDMLKDIVTSCEQKGQKRAVIFIGADPKIEE